MTHLWATKAVNPAVFLGLGPCTLNGVSYPVCSTTANTNQRRRLSLERPADGFYIGGLDEFDDGGTRNYNGLQLSAQHPVVKGLSINGNYTWSHCIGDFADTGSQGPGPGEGYVNPSDRNFDRGNCGSDRRHLFQFHISSSDTRSLRTQRCVPLQRAGECLGFTGSRRALP